MSMLEWAKKEIEIAKKELEKENNLESEYDVACYESAFKAFKSLFEDGHSGFSISLTKQILSRLIDGKALTPIAETEDVWGLYNTDKDGMYYQNIRMSSLFKDVSYDGTVTYEDIDACYCVNADNPSETWNNGFVREIYHEIFPIKMPYMPCSIPDKVICKEILTDSKNGDFDTLAILYIHKSNGDKVEVNRFFKTTEEGYTEITYEEYLDREIEAKKLKEVEENE